MKNILITGGAGFIGSRLCEKLFDLGYSITVLDNLSTQIHGNTESALYKRIKKKCIFIKGDVKNLDDWKQAIKGQEIIVHLAAETGTGQSMYESKKYYDVNVMGTSYMFDVLSSFNHNVQKIIVASSRAVYGEGKYFCSAHNEVYPTKRNELDLDSAEFNLKCDICGADLELLATDEDSRLNPLSVYGKTKHEQEQMVMFKGKKLKIPTVALRYQNVYGPGQSLSNPYTGIMSIFSTSILNGNDLDIYEDGLESRDFVYIEDAVDATILCIQSNDANGNIFNIGSGVPITVKEVAEYLKKSYCSNISIYVSGKYRIGDIRHNYADLSKATAVLGFIPKYPFKKGISKFVKWVKAQDVMEDKYKESIIELKQNGLIK